MKSSSKCSLLPSRGLAHLAILCACILCLSSKSYADQTVINFDSVATTYNGVDATSYLGTYGITLSNITPGGGTLGTGLVGIFSDTQFVQASSGDNYLTQNVGGAPAESFTMNFSTALSSFGFTSIANLTDNLVAEWTATAYSGATALDSVSSPFGLGSFSAKTYELSGPDITSVTFSADGFGEAGIPGADIDDLVLTTPSSVPDNSPSIALLFIACGSLAAMIGPLKVIRSRVMPA